MADKWTALDTFWNSFGIPAYDENTVPDDAVMPYITYEASISNVFDRIPLNGSLWYRSTAWQGISQKASEIESYIEGGVGVPYDGGRLWITKESPFAQRMNEPTDDFVRRIVLQIGAEYH